MNNTTEIQTRCENCGRDWGGLHTLLSSAITVCGHRLCNECNDRIIQDQGDCLACAKAFLLQPLNYRILTYQVCRLLRF